MAAYTNYKKNSVFILFLISESCDIIQRYILNSTEAALFIELW